MSYGIEDVSGNDYSVAMYLKIMLSYRYGQWSSKFSEYSSNYIVPNNLVDVIEKLYHKGRLKGC